MAVKGWRLKGETGEDVPFAFSKVRSSFLVGLGGWDIHRKGQLPRTSQIGTCFGVVIWLHQEWPLALAENNGSGIQRAMAHGPHEVQGGIGGPTI